MAENTKIQWCDHTFNPWIGCMKVSPGCAHCYAEAQDKHRKWTPEGFGPGKPRKRTSEANWREPVRWNEKARNMWGCSCGQFLENYVTEPGECPICGGRPHCWRPRVFCASLADWLDPEVPVEWLADLLDLIRRTPNLDWPLLTKRPENWYSRIVKVILRAEGVESDDESCMDWIPETELGRWLNEWTRTDGEGIPENVWIGASVEDQEAANKRIPGLLMIPARVRFLSCEPLLGAVDLTRWLDLQEVSQVKRIEGRFVYVSPTRFEKRPRTEVEIAHYGERELKIHWVICGGESGPNARPMHPDWARSLRDQCKAAGVPFFFKQWGEWLPETLETQANGPWREVPEVHIWPDGRAGIKGKECLFFSESLRRIGRRAAGRLLDGVEHNEFPKM